MCLGLAFCCELELGAVAAANADAEEEAEANALPPALLALLGNKAPSATGLGIDVGVVQEHTEGIVFTSDHLAIAGLFDLQ